LLGYPILRIFAYYLATDSRILRIERIGICDDVWETFKSFLNVQCIQKYVFCYKNRVFYAKNAFYTEGSLFYF
jgi:hypothetical protein